MGIVNSRDTRVMPFFENFAELDIEKKLIYDEVMGYKHNAKLQELVDFIAPQENVEITDDTKLFFGLHEKILAPHKELIKYLIENPTNDEAKARLEKYDNENEVKVADIIKNIEKYFTKQRKSYIFEGYTHPDAYIETEKHIIVVEGKRTENVSTSTKWLKNRDQMIRHIEGALQQADGKKTVLAYFMVESMPGTIANYIDLNYYKDSMPHFKNDDDKIKEVRDCYKGVFIWEDLFKKFKVYKP